MISTVVFGRMFFQVYSITIFGILNWGIFRLSVLLARIFQKSSIWPSVNHMIFGGY